MAVENITVSTSGVLLQKYYVAFAQYSANINVTSQCAEITFFNNGTSNVLIQNCLTLAPGQSFAINGNEYELDTSQYTVGFIGGGTNNCIVIRKFYTS